MLIATDIDGTLRTKEGVPACSRAFFQELGSAHEWTVVTGRTALNVTQALDGLAPTAPIILENGARLRHEGRTFFERLLDEAAQAWVSDRLEFCVFAAFATATGYVFYAPTGHIPAAVLPLVELVVTEPGRFAERLPRAAKVAMKLRNGLSFEDHPMVSLTRNEDFHDVMTRGTHKGSGLLELARCRGIPLSDIVVAGNDYNDVALFGVEGLAAKVAVGTVPPELARLATHFARDPADLPRVLAHFL